MFICFCSCRIICMRWLRSPGRSNAGRAGKFKGFTAKRAGIRWQRDFFDHRLRSDDSYEDKANYVRIQSGAEGAGGEEGRLPGCMGVGSRSGGPGGSAPPWVWPNMSSAHQMPLRFAPPVGGRVDVLVVAGEHSGDEHAARMVSGLRAARPGVAVAALGGPRLAAAGAQVLHDLTASSVVGFVEVLKHFPFFRALFHETLRWIAEHRPRVVCLRSTTRGSTCAWPRRCGRAGWA